MFNEEKKSGPDFAVRLYVSDISAPASFYDRWYGLMPAGRRERADRFKKEPDRMRCIMAYALLVRALKDLAKDLGTLNDWDLTDGSPVITEGSKGKPYLEKIPVYFNISHSGQRVAVALSPEEVGCDVERSRGEVLKIAGRFFSGTEFEFLSGIEDEEEQRLQFTKLWTLKESVVKCCGEGISHSFDDFSLTDENGKRCSEVILSGSTDVYHIKEFADENGYCYSICSICDKAEDSIRRICFDQEK